MLVAHNPQDLSLPAGALLTIGNFDGLHLGHQKLIAKALELGRQRGLAVLALTFWPHPRTVLARESHLPISTRAERLALLAGQGLEFVLEIPFNRELAAKSARDFFCATLLPLGMCGLVVGHDFSLGSGRMGNHAVLSALCAEFGLEFTRLGPVCLEGAPISSTRVREALGRGDVALAALLLGRPYSLGGQVIHGQGRGRSLGWPTANISVPETMLPREGVYSAKAFLGAEAYPAVLNIGRNPTFAGNELSLEAFLLGAEDDLYGRELRLELVDYLRPERKFASAEELKAQIAQDVQKAKMLLSPGAGR